jgi:hypothetical protein
MPACQAGTSSTAEISAHRQPALLGGVPPATFKWLR